MFEDCLLCLNPRNLNSQELVKAIQTEEQGFLDGRICWE